MLLQTCCAVCAVSVIEQLLPDHPELTLYFYNPNIQPEAEYQRRLAEVHKLPSLYPVKLIIGEYQPLQWLANTKQWKESPEGGERCQYCFNFRLRQTALKAKKLGEEIFATTLTVSPHKNHELINELGVLASQDFGITYLASNFKANKGHQRSIELAKKYGFYRQNYCGCIYSKQ